MQKTSLLLVIALCSLCSTVNAQYGCNCKKTKVLQEFNKVKKLIVQLSGDAAYDTALVRAVEAGWKLSPYEFADEEKVKDKLMSPNFAFLMSRCIYQITTVDGRPVVKRPNNQLMVVCGGKSTFDDENTVAFSTFDRQIPFTKDFRYEEDLRKM
ncbi:MAG TPA: hypothetical protein VK154_15890, partial [Chitinophagales bacterium]|nr:hypothetical protein [Chitinophagales bacterium]